MIDIGYYWEVSLLNIDNIHVSNMLSYFVELFKLVLMILLCLDVFGRIFDLFVFWGFMFVISSLWNSDKSLSQIYK